MYYVPFLYEYANEKLACMLTSICLIGGVKKDPDTNKRMSYFYEQCPVRHVHLVLFSIDGFMYVGLNWADIIDLLCCFILWFVVHY